MYYLCNMVSRVLYGYLEAVTDVHQRVSILSEYVANIWRWCLQIFSMIRVMRQYQHLLVFLSLLEMHNGADYTWIYVLLSMKMRRYSIRIIDTMWLYEEPCAAFDGKNSCVQDRQGRRRHGRVQTFN